MRMSHALLFCSALGLLACSGVPKEKSQTTAAKVKMISVEPGVKGEVVLTDDEKGILLTGNFQGLEPNSVHGLHIHEKGLCDGPDFKTAGEHFNPTNAPHGGPSAPSKHLGDLGNVVADALGNAKIEMILEEGEVKDLAVFKGKAIILHDGPDDLKTQPSGGSGERLACGVI